MRRLFAAVAISLMVMIAPVHSTTTVHHQAEISACFPPQCP